MTSEMTMKHTPGPWTATTDGSHEVYSEAEYQSVCMVLGTSYAKANSRLIAAAPDLLEALAEIRRIAADIPAVERNPRFAEASRAALAAIAKAEGRS